MLRPIHLDRPPKHKQAQGNAENQLFVPGQAMHMGQYIAMAEGSQWRRGEDSGNEIPSTNLQHPEKSQKSKSQIVLTNQVISMQLKNHEWTLMNTNLRTRTMIQPFTPQSLN
jgi:hypothetical protein